MSYMTLTRPTPTVWQITLTSAPDNRLTPDFLSALGQNLDTVEAQWRESGGAHPDPKKRGENKGSGALVLASSCGKFFSNGLDYQKSLGVKNFFEGALGVQAYGYGESGCMKEYWGRARAILGRYLVSGWKC
jgi:hypothetical protein